MDRPSRCSQSWRVVQHGGLSVTSLLFADDDFLVAGCSLQMKGKTLPVEFNYLEILVMEKKQCMRLTNQLCLKQQWNSSHHCTSLCCDAATQFVDKHLYLLLNLCPFPQLKSWAVSSDQKNVVMEMKFLCRVAGLTLHERIRRFIIRERLGVELKPVDMVWAHYKDASCLAPSWAVSGTSHRMESPGEEPGSTGDIHLTFVLGMSGDPSGGCGICGWG